MSIIKTFIKRNPALTYFALTFAISWGGVLLVIGRRSGIPGTSEQVERLFPIALLALLAGPGIASILLTGLIYGRAGFREFLSRLLKWRVGVRWYAVALLSAPLLAAAVLFALSLLSPDFFPVIVTTDDKASLLLLGLAVGLGGGFFEELGWTGFAVPRLRLRYGVLTTGLIVGPLWGAWHFLTHFWAIRTYSGTLSPTIFLLPFLLSGAAQLTAFRVLMVWVYDRTGSLLVAMLMHASLIASTVFIFMPAVATGVPLLTYIIVLAAALWVVVATVAIANRGQLLRQPLRR